MISLHSGNVHCETLLCAVSSIPLNEFISNVIFDKTTELWTKMMACVRIEGCVENEGGSSNQIVNIFLAREGTPVRFTRTTTTTTSSNIYTNIYTKCRVVDFSSFR